MSSNIKLQDWCPPVHHDPYDTPIDPRGVRLPTTFVVLVAGASRGIGAGIARSFATAGASGLILVGRTAHDLQVVADKCRSLSPLASGAKLVVKQLVVDITDAKAVSRLADTVRDDFGGRLDVVVVNAGSSQKPVPREDLGVGKMGSSRGFGAHVEGNDGTDQWERVMRVNLVAPYLVAHHTLPLLEATRNGAQTFIVISSAAARLTDPKILSAAYTLSKFAVCRFVQQVDMGHRGYGVCAYAIQPGGVKTDLVQYLPREFPVDKSRYP